MYTKLICLSNIAAKKCDLLSNALRVGLMHVLNGLLAGSKNKKMWPVVWVTCHIGCIFGTGRRQHIDTHYTKWTSSQSYTNPLMLDRKDLLLQMSQAILSFEPFTILSMIYYFILSNITSKQTNTTNTLLCIQISVVQNCRDVWENQTSFPFIFPIWQTSPNPACVAIKALRFVCFLWHIL